MCFFIAKRKKVYYSKLKFSDICDHKKFWKSVKHLFNQPQSTESIVLVENNTIVSDDSNISEIFNCFFGSAVTKLNIPPYKPFKDNFIISNDPILNIVEKYKNHPSILKISEVISPESSFAFNPIDISTVIKEIYCLNVSKACPMDSIPAKILIENMNVFGPKVLIDLNNCYYLMHT